MQFEIVWKPLNLSDTTASVNEKSFEVPTNQMWVPTSIQVTYVSTATVGNRRLFVNMETFGGVDIKVITAGTTQAASLTRIYSLGPNLPDLTAFRNTSFLTTPIDGATPLLEGDTLIIGDYENISATDTCVVMVRGMYRWLV